MESLLHISEPLLDSAETIRKMVVHAAVYEVMLFAAAIHLYEQGKKEFYFPDLVHTVRSEISDESPFEIYSDLRSNFDYLVNSGAFRAASTGRKKYMLQESVQQKLDKILQNHRK